MRYLISGGCGFLGSNIAARLIGEGHTIALFDNLSRHRSPENLAWLRGLASGDLDFIHGDIRCQNDITNAIRTRQPDVVFHLAGQVAMTTSVENPRKDFEINALGTVNLLEAVRNFKDDAIIIYSSTNKVYGDMADILLEERPTRYWAPEHPEGFSENARFKPSTPYGCSKASADTYVQDYFRIYGTRGVVFRHSSIYGSRQFATFDQGWIGWFCHVAQAQSRGETEIFSISGNGKQVRDVLHCDDAVDCYLSAVEHIDTITGEVYNIGGGMANSLSLLELFALIESNLGRPLTYTQKPWRQNDQMVFVADHTKATKDLLWKPKVDKEKGIEWMLAWTAQASEAR